MTQPCDLSAVEARRQIGAATLSVSALLESCIARIEERNPKVNAVVATCYERARKEAAVMDASKEHLPELPPLFGLPVLIKDLIDTEELTTTYGSLCFEGHVPQKDAGVVDSLRQAGAIILGKTNTPEFGAGANTFNKVYGATRNPHNTDLTCGGSSGGSAVAVACGMAPLAIGSDFGGSLRIPASFCGVIGMRPTPGRIPCASLAIGHSPLWTEGPMARSVEDAALCMAAIEGYDASDARATPLVERTSLAALDLKNIKIGVSADLGLAELDHEIRKVFENRVSTLAPCFAQTKTISPDLSAAPEVFRNIRVMDVYAATHKLIKAHGDKLGDNVTKNISLAKELSFADVAQANASHTTLFKAFHELFKTHDILICPATAVSPFPVEQPFPTEINGAPVEDYVAWYAVTWALSLMGCPIVTVPAGKDHNGMPFGLQIIAPRHRDGFAFCVAAEVENALKQKGVA
ncbi:MAG: amidase [Roseobacter sp.]